MLENGISEIPDPKPPIKLQKFSASTTLLGEALKLLM